MINLIALLGLVPFAPDTPKAPMLWWPEAANGVCPNGVHTSYQKGVGLLDSASVMIRWETLITNAKIETNFYGPTVWDVDLDGTPEVVVACEDPLDTTWPSRLIVMDGPTGAIEWTWSPPGDVMAFYAPPVSDLDGDGHPEIVLNYFTHTPPDTNWTWTVAIDGVTRTPKWTHGLISTFGPYWYTSCPSIEDIDGDGRPEVVIGVRWRVYCLNGEDGSLLWKNDSARVRVPGIADLNGDGIKEVVCKSRFNYTTQAPTALSGLDGSMVWRACGNGDTLIDALSEFTIADTDADGKPEVICAGSYWWPGGSDLCVFWLDGETGALKRRYIVSPHCAFSEHPPTTGQLDSDPALETVIWFWDNGILCLDGATAQKQWQWPPPPYHEGESTTVYGLSICDIDNDRENEVIAYIEKPQPWPPTNKRIVCMSGSGQPEWELKLNDPDYHYNSGIPTLADVDGDGYLEIVLLPKHSSKFKFKIRCIDNETALTRKEGYASGGPDLKALPGKLILFLPGTYSVDLSLYDLAGRKVKDLHKGHLGPGAHEFELSGLEPGVYVARLSYDGVITTKAVVIRR